MFSIVKTEERQKARELRAQGWSVKEIERRVGVARSTVSLWVRDIRLEDAQRRRLETKTTKGQLEAAARKAARGRLSREEYQLEGRLLVRERGASYAAGCMLYWAEGGKGRNSIQLSNSDPELLAYFAEFLRRHFGVPDDAFRISCNLFADHVHRQHEIERFWLTTLRLPTACLRKSIVNTYSKYSQKKRVNKLPYGTCRLAVHSTRIVQTIYGSIQEYGGFDRPAWLD
jgi:transcriptional regulator with XRE-family HTH domain